MGRIDFNKSISLIVAATVVAGNLAFADSSKNCITDLKLNNEGNNVRVNIYTNKPYTDSVVVSKKEGNKYVILVPETVSGVKSVPKICGSTNVNVSMQTVSAGKGYTKITLTSDRAINIVPKTITSAKTVSTTVNQPKIPPQPVQKPVAASKSVAKPSQKAKSVQSNSQKVKSVQKHVTLAKPVQKPTEAVKQKNTTPVTKSVSKSIQPVQKQVQKVQTSSVVPKPQVTDVSRNKPLEILENEVKTDKVSDIKENQQDKLLEQTIKDNDKIIKQRKLKINGKYKYASVVDSKLGVKECVKLILGELQTISLWKLLMLASAITFPIIVIMIILGLDKRVNKRINSIRKEEDDIAVMERALRENVEAVRAQKAMQQATGQDQQSYNSFDEMLDKYDDTPTMTDGYDVEDKTPQYKEEVEAVDSSDFELETPIQPELVEEIPEDDFYDIEDEQEGLISEETVSLDDFSVKEEEVKEDSCSSFDDFSEENIGTEVVPFEPDGVLADFSGVSDKEFFDELVMQSLAETDVNNLPDNTSADAIFGVMTEDETGIMLSDFEHDNFEQEQSNASDEVSNTDDDVTMLNEVKINDNTGLYLVNYDNSSSLVGHIADDYFVIKQFSEIVNGKIILKQTEKVDDVARYLVRVGQNKMIVEVGEKTMSRLIDL